jgi:uncharacterized protein YndB with AHSA1/START domain
MSQSASPAADRDSALELRMEREFAATPERVFAAWTKRDMMAQWWGPEGMTCPHCDLDLRVGGKWRTCMLGPDGKENWVSGVYREIVPNKRLAFTWAWEEKGVRGQETVVTLDFAPTTKGTRMVLLQRRFETAESAKMHGQGWSSSFDCLDRILA